MRFTTLTFLCFFLLTYISFWSIPRKLRPALLLLASVLFYAAWSIPFTLHFLGIVLVSHVLIRPLYSQKNRLLLGTVLVFNLGNLFFFKYFYLFLQIIHDASGLAFFTREGFNNYLSALTGEGSIVLPLAISFYTFQITAYAVDVYRGQIKTEHSLLHFALFIFFFPQLVAGPIMRESDFFWQIRENKSNRQSLESGMALLATGLIKKVVIADNLVSGVNAVFLDPAAYGWQAQVVAALGYSIRVYCDFSGYTDIARGCGKLLGFELPENFRGPYLSASLREMWQRWHVTLSTWLRDYLFIPLGGSRASPWRTQFNLVLSFTLGGLWHGANYTYIAWGFMHGLLLVVERPLRSLKQSLAFPLWLDRFLWPLRVFLVFSLFTVGTLFFNAPDIEHTWLMLQRIFLLSSGPAGPAQELILNLLPVCFLLNYLEYNSKTSHLLARLPSSVRFTLLTLYGLFTVALLGRFAPGGNDFIYFQF
ncbi:MAG: MBOAT family protein [Spirochaetales bacterium]|nr:MBOAT family protein [Spirochaetales bacterium]